MKERAPNKNAPFKENVYVSHGGNRSYLQELRDRKDIVIKEYSGLIDEWHPRKEFEKLARDIEEFIEHLKKSPAAEYVPNLRCVIGKDDYDQKALFLVQDRIEGYSLPKRDLLGNEMRKQLTEIMRGLIQAYIATFDGKNGRMVEIKPKNFMYGTSKNHPEEQVFLVDFVPLFEVPKGSIAGLLRSWVNDLGIPVEELKEEFSQLNKL